jgi:hypothetical protein
MTLTKQVKWRNVKCRRIESNKHNKESERLYCCVDRPEWKRTSRMVNFQGCTLLKLVNFQGNHLGCPEPRPHTQLFEASCSEKHPTHLEIRLVVLNSIGYGCKNEFLDRSEITIEQLYGWYFVGYLFLRGEEMCELDQLDNSMTCSYLLRELKQTLANVLLIVFYW